MLASLLHVNPPHLQQQAQAQQQQHSHSTLKNAIEVQATPISGPMPPDPKLMMEAFLAEVKSLFEASLQTKRLHSMSRQLQKEFVQKLKASNICMLPSFHHTLPTGQEQGTILALDVGGSTFRIALIELSGRDANDGCNGMEIKRMKTFPIDNVVRALRGRLFFDWMACRIEEVLDADHHEADNKADGPLPMAVAWSFPVHQTSTRSGALLPMGKGFRATEGVEGHDICELLTSACQARNLNVEFQGIVNDASATLLSQAYRDPSTRISIILGTGINSAIYLPVASLEKEKYGEREDAWFAEAKHVLVNTELSMFGKNVWDSTRWDEELNTKHPIPYFQPLEYKTSGRYLGELVRLVIVEAVERGLLYEGYMPKGLEGAYAFDTGLVAVFEGDTSPNLATASTAFTAVHPLPYSSPTPEDLHFIRDVSRLVTARAAAYVATAIHALWSLQQSSASACPACSNASSSPAQINSVKEDEKDKKDSSINSESKEKEISEEAVEDEEEEEEMKKNKITIACNGSIMEKYPGFKSACQGYLDQLVGLTFVEEEQDKTKKEKKESGVMRQAQVVIEMAFESSVFGAAVAAASDV